MKDYRQLKVWTRSHTLALGAYRATKAFPKEELFGLTSQIRRSAASIPANIAEGCGRYGDAELKRFITIALGSASELDYQLLLSSELGYLPAAEWNRLAAEVLQVRRMLGSLIKRLSPCPSLPV